MDVSKSLVLTAILYSYVVEVCKGQTKYDFSVPENSPISTIIGKVNIPGDVSQLRLIGQSGFTIENPSGNILTTGALDYEERSRYVLLVEMLRLSSATTSATVTVHVTDVNEPPRFLQSEQQLTIPSDFPISGLVGVFTAIDEDSGPAGSITYILQPSSPYFAIDIISGRLMKTSQIPNTGSITIHIRASDQGIPKKYTTTVVQIHVVSIQPTVSTPDANVSCSSVSFDLSVEENSPVGTVLLDLKQYVGAEAYTLEGGSGRFVLAANRDLQTSGHLDFEAQRFYDLTLSSVSGYSDINIRVSLLDVNDFPPMFFGVLSPLRVPYNFPTGHTLYKFLTWDGDQPGTENSNVSYSLHGHSDTFTINPQTGDLKLIQTQGSTSTYSLRIAANDHGYPSLQGFTDIEIDFFDPTIGFPVFESGFVLVNVLEGTPIGTFIHRAKAVSSQSDSIQYSIIGSTAQSQFAINSSTGVISSRVRMNSGSVSRAGIVVRATVTSNTGLNNDMMVQVDVNRWIEQPIFPFRCYSAVVPRDALPGRIVFRPQALAKHSDTKYLYTITGGNEEDIFELHGMLRLKKGLVNVETNSFILTIVAYNQMSSDRTKLLVTVQD